MPHNHNHSMNQMWTREIKRVYTRPASKRKADVLTEERYIVMKELSSRVQKGDEFDVFGEHVAYFLRSLTRKSNQNNAKFQTNNILYQFEINNQPPTCRSPCLATSSAVSTPSPHSATPVPSTHTAGHDIVYVTDLGFARCTRVKFEGRLQCGGAWLSTCLPSRASTAFGKFHFVLKIPSDEGHNCSSGVDLTMGCNISRIAEHVE
ncbi:hypothetical protein PR048_021931 [Dryococelus australis]|uniref:Uncharacterized protein n=1 Tax=Dryococelus australis TaxID=614101 RepID=A0ABQ9GZU2_9NEOP|nr:hypothetical protein PR048_021931 [Dryococelus australis]